MTTSYLTNALIEAPRKPDTKDTNPKDAVGTAKVPLSTVSAPVMAEVGLAMMEGARKYGRHNYRVSGVRASVYYDAVMRHLMSFFEGENTDPDSGLPHVVKAIACLVVLRDSQIQGNWVDDRPPKTPDGWVAELNEKAAALLEKYPDALPAHLETDSGVMKKVGPDTHEATVMVRDYRPPTVDSIEDADKAFYWNGQCLRYRWNAGRWEKSAISNAIDAGWLAVGHVSDRRLTRDLPVSDTFE